VKNVSPSVRRVLGLVIALVAGTLATTLIGVSPASAHHSTPKGGAVCDNNTGTYTITWTVTNSENHPEKLLLVSPTPGGTINNIAVNTVIDPLATVSGTQVVPGTTKFAVLKVQGHWDFDNFTERPHFSKPLKLDGKCVQYQPSPHATASSACDGTVLVTVSNDAAATKSATFTITGTNNFSTTTAAIPAGGHADVTVPAASASQISVMSGQTELGPFSWSAPTDCAPVKVASKSDCTTLTVSLENPAGNTPVDATVTSGDKTEKVTIPSGTTKDVTFPASAGTTATVTFGSGAADSAKVAAAAAAAATTPITVSWVSPGAVCTPTSPPSLPQTGAKLGGIIGAGAALIVVGAGLLLFLRRRRNIAAVR